MIKSNEKLIQETDEKEKEVLNVLFRNMHTIKGNARTYGFLFLTNQVHEAEQTYDDLRKNNEVLWDKDRLLKELNQTLELLQKYSQINENKLGRKGPGRRGSTERFVMVEKEIIEHTLRSLEQVDKNDFAQLKKSINETANMLRLIGTAPIKEVISGILDSLPSLADQTGKAHPIITINDNNIYIKNQVFGLLNNAFMHLYRNSMDHGIETPDERKQKGKNPTGTIELNLSIEEGFLVFRFKDDGKGLAISKINQKAITIGVITSAENISLQDSANLIFLSGVSTAEKVTDVSGRGVGMDAVKNFFKQEKGDVFIQVLDELNPNQDFVPIQLVLKLPEHFAVKIG
jgi:two-component system chemotaxis sensor kinase CheA